LSISALQVEEKESAMTTAEQSDGGGAAGAAVSSPSPPAAAPQRGSKSVVQTIGSKLIIQALSALTGILTARTLMPEGRGQLAAITLWSLFLAGTTTLGVPAAMVYFIRSRPDLRRTLLSTGLLLALGTGAIALLIGVLGLPHWMHQYPAWIILYAQIFMVLAPLCSLSFVQRAILESNGNFSASNLSQILNPLITIVCLFSLFAVHRLTVLSAAISYCIAIIPVVALLAVKLRPYLAEATRPSVSAAKLLLSYGVRSYGIDLIGQLALQVDQVLVISLLTPSAMGTYSVMISLSRMFNIFQNSVTSVLFPKAAGNSTEKVLEMTGRAARVSMCITGVATASVAVFGPWLIKVFYGKDYTSASTCLRILLLEVTISGLVLVQSQAFMALGRPGVNTILQGIGLSTSVPLMLVLIPRLGLTGAALSLLASTVVRLALVCGSFIVVLKTHVPDLRPRVADFEMLFRMVGRKQQKAGA
jgi:O-antigen/teichoic acid export membrane protein